MRKQGVLDEKLDKVGFSQKTVRLRAVSLTSPNGTNYPQAYRMIPATRQDKDLLEQLLGDNASAFIFGTAGFMPVIEDEAYACRVRAKGKINLAFPAQRWRLRGKTWRPGLWRTSREIVLGPSPKKIPGRDPVWLGRHPETGQAVIGFHIEKEPAADGQIHIKPEDGYALMPRHTDSWWALASNERLKSMSEADLSLYDETVAATASKRVRPNYSQAKEFNVFGYRTAFEIFGSPRGGASSLEQLSKNGWDWFQECEAWLGKPLISALHEDAWPIDFKSDDKTRASRIVAGIRANGSEALEWARAWLQYHLGRLARRKSLGLSVRFEIPRPAGRPLRTEKPLIELEVRELRGLLAKAVQEPSLLSPPTFEEESDAEDKDGQSAASSPRRPTTETVDHVEPETRTFATTGDAPPDTIGDRLHQQGGEKPKTRYFGYCSVCQEHRIRTNKPELSGEVLPGAVCPKCAKRNPQLKTKKQGRRPRGDSD